MEDKTPVVDQESCIGCGLCVTIASETFDFNDNGKAKIVNPQGNSENDIQEAIDSCPVKAIRWR